MNLDFLQWGKGGRHNVSVFAFVFLPYDLLLNQSHSQWSHFDKFSLLLEENSNTKNDSNNYHLENIY